HLYVCSFSLFPRHRELRSFPTRRSSDLGGKKGRNGELPSADRALRQSMSGVEKLAPAAKGELPGEGRRHYMAPIPVRSATIGPRSEEHTSELQSRVDLVCRLLLEKKNKT